MFELDYKPRNLQLIVRDDKHYPETIAKLKRITNVTFRDDSSIVVSNRKKLSIPRRFYWLGLKSSQFIEYRLLWALMHFILKSHFKSFKAKQIAELTGDDISIITQFLKLMVEHEVLTRIGDSYSMDDSNFEYCLIQDIFNDVPQEVDEIVMLYLCCNPGAKKKEVCSFVSDAWGDSESGVYQSIKRLEKENYVKATPKKQVGKKGPAIDILSVCCDNCFFFSSKSKCVDSELEKLSSYAEKLWGRKPDANGRAAFMKLPTDDSLRLLQTLNSILQYLVQIKLDATMSDPQRERLLNAVQFLERELGFSLNLSQIIK